MIKATIGKSENGESLILSVKGHAQFAPQGEDIICAGVSTLVYTLAQIASFYYEQGKLQKRPNIQLESADALVVMKPKAEAFGEVMLSYFYTQVGLGLLADNYPGCVELNAFGQNYGAKSE